MALTQVWTRPRDAVEEHGPPGPARGQIQVFRMDVFFFVEC